MQRQMRFFSIIAFLLAAFSGFPLRAQTLPITTSSEKAREDFIKARNFAFHWEASQGKQLLIEAVSEDPSFVLAYLHLVGLSHSRFQRKRYMRLAELHRSQVSKGEQRMIDAFRAAFLDADYERAVSILSELSDEYPDDPYLEGYIGIRYCFYLHNCKEAARHFQNALKRDPHFIQGYHLLGWAAFMDKDYDAAEKYFKKYVSLAPDHWNPYTSLGALYVRTARYDEADKQFGLAFEHDATGNARDDAAFYLYMLNGKNEEAEKLLKENIRLHGINPGMYNSLGEFYLFTRRYEEASQQFKRALLIDPNFLVSRDNLIHSSIGQVNQLFEQAFRQQNAGAISSLYTSGGKLLPAGRNPVTGTDAIRKFWKDQFDGGLTKANLKTLEVYVGSDGETATEVGQYKLLAGNKTADEGKYVVIWKMTPEGWKLHRDIWTTNRTVEQYIEIAK